MDLACRHQRGSQEETALLPRGARARDDAGGERNGPRTRGTIGACDSRRRPTGASEARSFPPLLRRPRLPEHRSDSRRSHRHGLREPARGAQDPSQSTQRGGREMNDVQLRAKASSWSFRRLTLLVAAALLAALAVGSALALSGRIGGLFHGTPVNDLTPRERFLLSEFDMKGRVELIATRNATAFYVIRRGDGRLCYSIGDVRKNLTPFQRESRTRFSGAAGCIDPRIFPSRAMPVLNFSYYSYRAGDLESRLAGLQGFAADAVDRIGVIGRDKRIVFSVPVVHNVYTAGRKGISGARGIVALGKDGKVLWVQCTAMGSSPAPQFPSGGCGKYKNSPPPNVPSASHSTKPVGPSGPVVVQRGTADGVAIVVRGAEIEARFGGISAETRRLLENKQGRINVGCLKLVTIGHNHYSS